MENEELITITEVWRMEKDQSVPVELIAKFANGLPLFIPKGITVRYLHYPKKEFDLGNYNKLYGNVSFNPPKTGIKE